MAIKAIKDYKKLSDGDLANKATQVITGTGGNAYYLALALKVAETTDAKDNFTGALAVSRYGSTVQKEQKNVYRLVLVTKLDELCDGVNNATPGNAVALKSTNSSTSAESTGRVVMQPLKKFIVKNGKNPGDIIINAVKGRGTVMVVCEYAIGKVIDASTIWTPCAASRNICNLTNIPSGETIWVRATSYGRWEQTLVAVAIKTIVL
jgi:hypothetical protein